MRTIAIVAVDIAFAGQRHPTKARKPLFKRFALVILIAPRFVKRVIIALLCIVLTIILCSWLFALRLGTQWLHPCSSTHVGTKSVGDKLCYGSIGALE